MFEFRLHHLRCLPEDLLSMVKMTKLSHQRASPAHRVKEHSMSRTGNGLRFDPTCRKSSKPATHWMLAEDTRLLGQRQRTFLLTHGSSHIPASVPWAPIPTGWCEESQMTPEHSLGWNRNLWNQNLLYCRVNMPALCPGGKHCFCLPKMFARKHRWNDSLKQKQSGPVFSRHVEI